MQNVTISPSSVATMWLCSQTISGKRAEISSSDSADAASMSSSLIVPKLRSIT